MNTIARIGVDLAKNVMQIHAVDQSGHIVTRKAISRANFLNRFANLPPCLVAMEACSAAHYWARRLRSLGHDVRLIPPQFVAPYRKGGSRMKNDALDAEAVCEAASRPQMRFVPVKSPAQQSVLVLHRLRTGYVEERTALVNRLRGLLAEFGVFLPQGIDKLHAHFVEHIEDGTNELTGTAREALMRGWAQWQALDQEIAWFDRQIATHARQDPHAKRCMDMCGIGPLTASATVATIVDARQFKNGRQMAAWLGTVPRQKSSGGKQRLGRITKQGNEYLRMLLFLGARAALNTAHRRNDRLSRWILQLRARIGYNKTLIAVANKHARILWAILAKGEKFDPAHVCPSAAT
ncbi:IS110 family transposase [Cupriavidus lacunae]|uniref:IS110 family transposase n=2 Tax=Cupriavidus lacunae TaxID=2666307 RepID=A0A370MUX0_9BURK|nr:IS110 family transposase [Cupriavidus lacunae]RDJ97169.1 IS110 family transposase [Cupriavidus lacunae]